MSENNSLKEAERMMIICNACRYCEGFCPVFPAMELRRNFTARDLKYFANLCHNCRGCYYACQYAPPHDFNVNVPKVLGELRMDTYREFAWPGFLSGLFRLNGLAASLITMMSVAITMSYVLVSQGISGLFSIHLGENAFYEVIPFLYIVIPISVLAIFILIILAVGLTLFWHRTGGTLGELTDLAAIRRAIWDVLRLKFLDGGGYGCNYPDERFSHIRCWFHHLMFYGFMLCFISTVFAAIYAHFLNWGPPYPFLSWSVISGTVGCTALLIGTTGLLCLKVKMNKAPVAQNSIGMDVGFLVLLFLTSATGILLLFLRQTPAMGFLLAVHIGIVVGLFETMPYGKFVHAVYRFGALYRYAIEQSGGKKEFQK